MSPPASSTLNCASQLQQAAEEAVHPALRQAPWQGERKKHRLRLPAHGSDVTESARQTAVPHALRRVPRPLEVDVLQAEIGGNQDLMTARDGNHSTVVPDADATRSWHVVLQPGRECGGSALSRAGARRNHIYHGATWSGRAKLGKHGWPSSSRHWLSSFARPSRVKDPSPHDWHNGHVTLPPKVTTE